MGRDSTLPFPAYRVSDHDEVVLISSLKDLIGAGDYRLDTMLTAIVEASRRLTAATGAAIAMWKDGAMLCRARCGDTAPALGAQLNAEAGISGECLRTGKIQHCSDTENNPLVDVEVCRSLGLRSIAVLPIQGWRGINGILEVFSTEPLAFTEHHLEVLEQLAGLAERARSSQPHGASSPAVASSVPAEKPKPAGLLPASDRLGDVALAFVNRRSRPFVLGAALLATIALIGFVIWLGWRGPSDSDGKAHAAAPSISTTVTASVHVPDDDPVWRPNPGGELLSPSGVKPSAGTPVRLASKVETIEVQTGHSNHSLLTAEDATRPATTATRPVETTANPPQASAAETSSGEVPPMPATQTDASSLNGVLMASASIPSLTAPVSQGISGGRLLRRVSPVYPAQALALKVEGRVVLSAMVIENGTIGDLKVVEGSAVLTPSAVDAVKHWLYQPFKLDGKPIRRETLVTIDFKLPAGGR
jgi:TonB family protein